MVQNKFAFVQNHVNQNPADYNVRSWYYFGASGEMQTGWKYITYNGSTQWYYFKVNGTDDPYAADGANIHSNTNFNFSANTNINSGHNEFGNQYPYYIPSFKVKVLHKYRQANGSFSTTTAYSNVTLNNIDSNGYITGSTTVYPNVKNIDSNVKYTYSGDSSKSVKVSIKGDDNGMNFTVNDTTNDIEFVYERPSYSVSLSKGKGIASVSGAGSYYYGATVKISATPSSGYTFSNWSGTYTTGSFTMPLKNVSMTANATTTTYTISYNLNGGSASNATSYTVENNTFTLSNPTRNGYTFAGWTGSNGSTKQINLSVSKGSTGNKTYTANWTPINYSITYNLDGGTASNKTSYTIETDTFKLNNPTKTGYTFLGWTESNGTTAQMNVSISKGSTGNKNYTATYRKNVYTITTKNTGSGVISNSSKVDYAKNTSVFITPANGYTTSSLKIDGVSVSPVTKYNFINVEKNHTVEATFTITQNKKMELIQKGYSWIDLKL